MQDLRITLIQTDIHWEDKAANMAQLEEKIWKIDGPTDIIVLPEMFTTGFTMTTNKHAELMNMETFKWMEQMATQTNAVVTGSYIVAEAGHYYNRLLWMYPDGNYTVYDKRHLFRMAQEHHHFSAGQDFLVAEYKGWRICPLICYDLRFPSWSRNSYIVEQEIMDYDLLIYVANWPLARVHAWDTLLQARAIENLSYAVGVNRIGVDGNGIPYNGHSMTVNYKGEIVHNMLTSEGIHTSTLSLDKLIDYRIKFPAHLDADDVKVL